MYTIKTPVVILSLMILFFACTESRNKQHKKILMLENTLQDSYDTLKMAKLVESYDNYVNDFPADSLASVYVFRAAEMNRVLGKGTEALSDYHLLIKKYPESVYVPEAYFFIAVVYENVLYDFTKASVSYREFMDKFPEHTLVKDAKLSLEYLGKSPEEIIKMFESRQLEDTL